MAVVLAAGAGSRFRGHEHKLLARIGGVPIAARAITSALDAAIGPVVVITGALDLERELGGHGDLDRGTPGTGDVRFEHHPQWAAGQATSLHLAIETARQAGMDAVVVGLADQPFVPPEAWRAVAASRAPIAVATYDGRRGNPVRLHRSVWPLLPTEGDEGARRVIRLHPDLVEQVPCAGSAADIDTWEDLQQWQNNS